MIAVTGASGHVGGLVARELAARGVEMRLLVRDPSRAPTVAGAGVVEADYGRPDLLADALREGDRVFMVSMHQPPDRRVELHRSFIDAASRAGVAHVTYLSFLHAGPQAVFLHARAHGATESLLRESGLGWAAIRNGMYADNIPGWFDPDGVLREPCAEGRISFSYRPDIAKAIVATLLEEGHDGKTYDIVTPPAVRLAELAEIASEVTGRRYRFEPTSDEDWEARWQALGRVSWEREAGHTSYDAFRTGELQVESDDFRLLTGLDPRSVADVIAARIDAMPDGS